MKKQIVNIINFIRGVEPRVHVDLMEPVKEQIMLLEKYNLPGTFLIQYDALIQSEYTTLLKGISNGNVEIGVWLEIMKPLVEDCGIVWRGRANFDWDWHANVGFSVGYTCAERMKVIDALFERFKEAFGYYPKSVGSWLIDAFSLEYMAKKYHIVASCNCKDQWGTDGYTLWGGYYGQAYYPSRHNAYTPAQTAAHQINVPVFKMLGSDPIYQYDLGLNVMDDESPASQHVVTLEPVYAGNTGGGGVPDWVDWYLDENFNGKCINFGYTQAGQENSFGWDAMKNGLTYQMAKIAELAGAGKVEVMTLAESGRWFAGRFATTPPTAIAALTDWKCEGRKSVWFNSKNYRMNIYAENDRFWIRDWHVYDENYTERYIDSVCTETYLVYDNLPVIDGNRWSGNGVRAGIYPCLPGGGAITFTAVSVDDASGSLVITLQTNAGVFKIECREDDVSFSCTGGAFEMRFLSARDLPVVTASDRGICFSHNKHSYGISLKKGFIEPENGLALRSEQQSIVINYKETVVDELD